MEAGFAEQSLDAERVKLLGVEAVGTVDLKEEFGEAERFANRTRRMHRLVAEHRHFARFVAVPRSGELLQRIDHVLVNVSVVELVFAIVREKKLDRFGNKAVIVGIAQRASDEHG